MNEFFQTCADVGQNNKKIVKEKTDILKKQVIIH